VGLSVQSEAHTGIVTPPVTQRSGQPIHATGDLNQKLKAAEARIAQLERANGTLLRGTQRILSADRVEAILDALLLEAVSLTGAPSAVIVGRENGPEFIIRSSVREGTITHPDPQCRYRRFQNITAAHSGAEIEKILIGEPFRVSIPDIDPAYAESADFNLSPDLRFIWHFPFDSSGRVVGFLALAFTESCSFCELNMDAVQALSEQASLALKVIHLSEEAKRGAVACEREKAAQTLASQLVNANALIRATLQELANTEDSSGFVKATLREVCRQAHAQAAHLFTYDSSSNRLVQFGVVKDDVFHDAHPDDPPSFHEGLDASMIPGSQRLGQRGELHWMIAETPGVDVSPDTMHWHRKLGHTGYASQVLVVGCKPIGLLGLTYNDGRQLSSEKAELIQVLAQHMALALGLMRLTDRARDAAILAERERAADARACELAKTNAALRSATDRLATQTELGSFYGHLVEQAAHLLDANSAHLTILDEASHSLRTLAYLKHGVLSVPDYPVELSVSKTSSALKRLCSMRGLSYLDLERDSDLFSQGASEFHRTSGHRTLVAVPLVLGDQCIGYIGLAFVGEQRLRPEQQELLQTLAQHATLAVHLTRLAEQVRRGAVLEERVALARDMHDTLLQGFTGITLQLRALLKGAPKETHQMHSILEAIEAEATRSVREARRAVGDMRGNEPGTADLVTALQELVQRESSRTSAHLCWKLEGEPRELPGHVAESVFRIGREALRNAIRHANATCVELSLSIAHSSLHLRVTDNGRGFEITPEIARRRGHWGLVGMQERAERLGGKWKVNSEPGRGAAISIEIPV